MCAEGYSSSTWKLFDRQLFKWHVKIKPQRLISLRFGPLCCACAISSGYSVSRVVMSEAELDNFIRHCFNFLLLTVVKRLFQQLDFTMLTTCSSDKFELLNDYWTEYFPMPTTDVFDDELVIALYHDVLDVAGQVHIEGSAQILHGTNILDCIFSLPKLVVASNYTRSVDTPLGSQHEETNSRNRVAWVFDKSLRRDKISRDYTYHILLRANYIICLFFFKL
ncbi:uncharacterized protein LOC129903076 [Solanum dulcamara]|uniref:uncharacterized protein LOC129903076 n=1 Tax=Solanum dulcamara TaxID=45834 RepID=UPI002486B019|nr:uncharacterized protein LOC129903076 [Solanum dulcamara]